jgi:hypothetical protein
MGTHYITPLTGKIYCDFRLNNLSKEIYLPKTTIQLILEKKGVDFNFNPQKFITWK